jgi:hypothetical protein
MSKTAATPTSVKDRVKAILLNSAKARTDDMVLTAMYWEKYDAKNVGGDILKAMKSGGEVTRPETIRRARQVLQAEYADLRHADYAGVPVGRKKAGRG